MQQSCNVTASEHQSPGEIGSLEGILLQKAIPKSRTPTIVSLVRVWGNVSKVRVCLGSYLSQYLIHTYQPCTTMQSGVNIHVQKKSQGSSRGGELASSFIYKLQHSCIFPSLRYFMYLPEQTAQDSSRQLIKSLRDSMPTCDFPLG